AESPDLDVSFFHDVEEAHLDARLQVRQLIDDEDAAVGAGYDAELDRAFVAVADFLVERLDGIDVADQVGHGNVRRGQFLAVAAFAADPLHGRIVALPGDHFARVTGDGRERIVVDFAARHNGNPVVQEIRQLPEDAGLSLSAK